LAQSDDGDSLYLQNKKIHPHGLKYAPNCILIPLCDINGKLWSYQTIFDNGTKLFCKGGKITGNFHLIGDFADSNSLLVCEGYATGATIHQATGITTAITFNAGNISAVVSIIRDTYPELSITIAADNDQYKAVNTGKMRAEEAAKIYGCKVVLPHFKDTSTKPTDFNDLASLEGEGEVIRQLLSLPEVAKTTQEIEFPQHLLDNAPGLPGLIARWINDTALLKQPILALGAAIAASGTLYAHKIRSETNLRTNFMILGIARSGIGKDHARKCIKNLFSTLDLSRYISNKYASDSGLLNLLAETNGIGLSVMDEIGKELKALTSRYAGSYEAGILTVMMELFSSANTTYDGKSYATKENNITLIQPCFNVYGASTPSRFYEALTSGDAIDGLLARWLIFETKDINPTKQKVDYNDTVPDEILEAIRIIAPALTSSDYSLNGYEVKPAVVKYSDSARQILDNFETLCNNKRLAEISAGGNLDSIWARTVEHAIKLALVAHPIGYNIIDSVTMEWATELSLYLTNVAINAIRANVSESEYDKNRQKVFSTIENFCNIHRKPIKQWELSAYIKGIRPRDLTEIINHLLQSQKIQMVKTSYKGRESTSFTLFNNIN